MFIEILVVSSYLTAPGTDGTDGTDGCNFFEVLILLAMK